MPPAARSSGFALQRMPAFPLARDFRHRAEANAGSLFHMFHQPVEHQQTMAAADDLRMHGQTIDAHADEIAQIIEITRPSLVNLRRCREPLVHSIKPLESGKVVESPGHWQFN